MVPPYKVPKYRTKVNIEIGNTKVYQLCNLKTNISQKRNLFNDKPKKTKRDDSWLTKRENEIIN